MDNLKTSLKDLNLKSNGRLFGFGINPHKDWKIIFIVAVVLVVLVTILNVVVFFRVDKGEISVVEGEGSEGIRAVDLEELRETVLYYQTKAQEFERIKNATSTAVVDPSL